MLGLVKKGLMSIETEYHFLIEGQYIIETSWLICKVNQLTGFYRVKIGLD